MFPVPRLRFQPRHLACCSLAGGAGLATEATAHHGGSSVQGARWLGCPADDEEGLLPESGCPYLDSRLGGGHKTKEFGAIPKYSHGMQKKPPPPHAFQGPTMVLITESEEVRRRLLSRVGQDQSVAQG